MDLRSLIYESLGMIKKRRFIKDPINGICISLEEKSVIVCHVYPLLRNDHEISNYTTDIAS
jgi:hypothetical protein